MAQFRWIIMSLLLMLLFHFIETAVPYSTSAVRAGDDEDDLQSSGEKPGETTQTDDDIADPEGGVSYASISYTKKTNRRAQTHVDDDDDDAVTYSVMKASSSSAPACADPSEFYATVNKQKE
ncbi:hypothetical protein PFLUV_G00216590 [Perca fluviatilis]|uniref:Secreted phosphoprotein 1 n=1 Tax=Perca fluviatilis TaxID=8168 RepID=A0A6A5EF54_PERFL|nr:hypothetical protein PFLUV_G00216590 [Perca fluviatilis]